MKVWWKVLHGFVGNLPGFPAVKYFENPLRIDKVIAMNSVYCFFWDTVYSFQKMIPIWMRYKRLSENYIFLVSVFMRLAQTPSCFISSPQSELQWIESPRRFLPRDAIQARPMPSCSVCVCVCVCVCLSVCHVRGSCQNE